MKNSSLIIFLSVLASVIGIGGVALGASPDVRSRLYRAPAIQTLSAEEDSVRRYVPMIIELEDGDDSVLEDLEIVVFHRRGQLVLASVPEENVDHLFKSSKIDKLSIARRAFRQLDVARRVSGVDVLQSGVRVDVASTIERAFNGEGVLTGIVDVGFDPSHVAFGDRLIFWSIYDEEKASRRVFDGHEAILNSGVETDNPSETHATHVGNILAGGFLDAPYYGVATGSKFAVSTSAITDVGLLAGIEDIISVAERDNLPCVINVSCGSYLGPHDGSDLFNRYLEALEDRAIICFSAGNYGRRDINIDVTLSADSTQTVGSTWCDTRKWDGFLVNGSSDFWSDNETRFELQYAVFDCNERRYVYQSPWVGREGEGYWELTLDTVPELRELFKPGCGVAVAWGLDPSNNRFNLSVDYGSITEESQSAGPWARYFTGFRLRSVNGSVRVRAWSDGVYTYFHGNGVPSAIRANSDNSATNFANGNTGIVVGAWNSRNTTPIWGTDKAQDYGFSVNQIADWSASGETFEGRRLPDICGPGNIIVSAMSSPHFATGNHPVPAAESNSCYWYAEAGTSMSSPVVAGILALWKQYFPELKTLDARRILIESANRNFSDIDNPRWGNGAVDAVAGFHRLVEFAKSHGVNDVVVDRDAVEYYNLQGIRLPSPESGRGSVVIVRYYDKTKNSYSAKKILVP